VSYERGPRFVPADSDDPPRRIRRLEDWAGRHEQWSAQSAVEGHEKVVRVEERVTVLEGKVIRLFASVGEHRLKWGVVAWVVGTAVAAAIAWATK
jgi:hypothetical protein